MKLMLAMLVLALPALALAMPALAMPVLALPALVLSHFLAQVMVLSHFRAQVLVPLALEMELAPAPAPLNRIRSTQRCLKCLRRARQVSFSWLRVVERKRQNHECGALRLE